MPVMFCRVYKDKVGALHDKHPVYDYYIGAMFMDLGGYRQLKAIAASRPPTAEEVSVTLRPTTLPAAAASAYASARAVDMYLRKRRQGR